jgi:hypothetical protein
MANLGTCLGASSSGSSIAYGFTTSISPSYPESREEISSAYTSSEAAELLGLVVLVELERLNAS